MKCPNCGFNSFDYLEECKKCKLPLNPSREYKSLYKKVPRKVHRKAVAGSVNPGETKVEKTVGYRGHGKGAGESAVSEDILNNSQSSTVDNEADLAQGFPQYYKRGQGRALPSDAGGGGPEHEVRSGGIKPRGQGRALPSDAGELNSSESLRSAQDESAETRAPELGSDPALHDDFGLRSPDPILYSESLSPLNATNLPEVPDSKEGAESYSIAGLKLRATAFVIDLAIVGLIAYLAIGAAFFIMSDTVIEPRELSRVFLPIYALLFFLASTYFVFLHYYAGKTLGKMAVGIKIISSEGRELGLWESFMRWVGYYISAVFLFAGFIWPVFDQDSQAWHDKIASTYVVVG